MISRIRRTEIRIETHEIEVVRFPQRQVLALCERCRELLMTPPTPERTAEIEGSQEMAFRVRPDGCAHLTQHEPRHDTSKP